MIDWVTTIVFLAGAACFTLAVSFGGTTFSWTSGTEIALWTVTGVLLIVTILLTIFHPGVSEENRLYPAHYLKRPILVNLQLQVFLVSGIMLVSGHILCVMCVGPLTNFVDDDLLYTTLLPVYTGMYNVSLTDSALKATRETGRSRLEFACSRSSSLWWSSPC